MKSKFSTALLMSIFLAGCGYELPKTGEPADNSNKTASNRPQNTSPGGNNGNSNLPVANTSDRKSTEGGEKLVFSASGQISTQECGGREVEFEESSTANTINLTGECKKLVVDGVSNRVTVEKVGEIVVRGISNKVIYGEGLGGKKPKISKSGTSTAVDSKEEIAKKKAAEK